MTTEPRTIEILNEKHLVYRLYLNQRPIKEYYSFLNDTVDTGSITFQEGMNGTVLCSTQLNPQRFSFQIDGRTLHIFDDMSIKTKPAIPVISRLPIPITQDITTIRIHSIYPSLQSIPESTPVTNPPSWWKV